MAKEPHINKAAETSVLKMLADGSPWSKTDIIYNCTMKRDRQFRSVDMQVAVADAIERLEQESLIKKQQSGFGRYYITQSGVSAYEKCVERKR